MTAESDTMAGATIELLEARVRRLSYLLGGATDWTGTPATPEKPASLDETVSRRLAQLERELEKLTRHIPAVRDVLQLRKCDLKSLSTDTAPLLITTAAPYTITKPPCKAIASHTPKCYFLHHTNNSATR